MSDAVEKLITQAESLESERLPNESIWEELARICFPRRGPIVQRAGVMPQTDRLARLTDNFDGTAMRACQTLAYGQSSRITPAGGRWFVLRPSSKHRGKPSAERWAARATEQLVGMLGSSNFYSRTNQCYHERGGLGLSALEVTSGLGGRGLHFRTIPVGSFTIAENSVDEVDTVFRKHYRTPAQIVQQFKDGGTIPDAVLKLFNDAGTRHKPSELVLHPVYPRQDRDPRKADPRNKPVASCHVHVASKTMMLEAGFDSMPIAVSRWQTNPYNPYGWAPADYALPEALQANFQEEMLDVLAETAAYPRILYPAGFKDEIAFEGMGLTSFDPGGGDQALPREWLTGGRYDIAKDRADDKKRAIEDAFFVDLFKAISRLDPKATATQISAIVSESREMFQPIHSNMIREFHIPVLQRCLALGIQQGIIDSPPDSMIEQDELGNFIADPEVEFVSAFALALEADHLTNLNTIISVVGPLAQVDPRWIRPFNPDTIVPGLVRQAGLPTEYLRTEEEQAAIAQAEQEAAAAQAAEQMTGAVRNLGGVDETAKAADMLTA